MASNFYNVANNVHTRLAADYTAGSGSLSVLSTAGMPAAPFIITVGNVIYPVTAVNGTTLTIGSPLQGTTDVSLPMTTDVWMYFTAGHYKHHSTAINALENSAVTVNSPAGSLQYSTGTNLAGSTTFNVSDTNKAIETVTNSIGGIGNNSGATIYIRDDTSTSDIIRRGIVLDHRTDNINVSRLRIAAGCTHSYGSATAGYVEVACIDIGCNRTNGFVDFYSGGTINADPVVHAMRLDEHGYVNVYQGINYLGSAPFTLGTFLNYAEPSSCVMIGKDQRHGMVITSAGVFAGTNMLDLRQGDGFPSPGTSLAVFDGFGRLYLGGGRDNNGAELTVNPYTASTVGQLTRGLANQTGDLTQWANSNNTVLARVDAAGVYHGSVAVSGSGNGIVYNSGGNIAGTTNTFIDDTNFGMKFLCSAITAGTPYYTNGGIYFRDDNSPNNTIRRGLVLDRRNNQSTNSWLRMSAATSYQYSNVSYGFQEAAAVDVGFDYTGHGSIKFMCGGVDINGGSLQEAGGFNGGGVFYVNYGIQYNSSNTFNIGVSNSPDGACRFAIYKSNQRGLVLQTNAYFNGKNPTYDTLQIQRWDGTALSTVDGDGCWNFGSSTFAGGTINVTAPVAGVGQVLRGQTNQTGDLLQCWDVNGNVLSKVDALGASHPPQLADSAAQNGSMYYSTNQNNFVYKDGSGKVLTLNSVAPGTNGTLPVNTNGAFTASNIYQDSNGRIGIGTTSPGGVFQIGANNTAGNFRVVANGDSSYFGIWDNYQQTYYGIANTLGQPIYQCVAIGGWYNGWGVLGRSSSSTNTPIFGINDDTQTGGAHGIGQNHFHIGTNHTITGYHNQLDGPNGEAAFAGNIGFFGTSPASKPSVSGSWSSGTAAKSLLAALVSLGLVTDNTTS